MFDRNNFDTLHVRENPPQSMMKRFSDSLYGLSNDPMVNDFEPCFWYSRGRLSFSSPYCEVASFQK